MIRFSDFIFTEFRSNIKRKEESEMETLDDLALAVIVDLDEYIANAMCACQQSGDNPYST